MDRLTNEQIFRLIRVRTVASVAGEALSDHELQLLAEVDERFQRYRRATVVTAEEWRVIDDAMGAMASHLAKRVHTAAKVMRRAA